MGPGRGERRGWETPCPSPHPPTPASGDCPWTLSAQVPSIRLPRPPKRETETYRAPFKAKQGYRLGLA